jgi:hypothetical protein
MDNPEIRFLGDLQRLDVKPGDTFVLTVDCDISQHEAESIQQLWAKVMGDVRCLVLGKGMKLGAISAPAEDV